MKKLMWVALAIIGFCLALVYAYYHLNMNHS